MPLLLTAFVVDHPAFAMFVVLASAAVVVALVIWRQEHRYRRDKARDRDDAHRRDHGDMGDWQ